MLSNLMTVGGQVIMLFLMMISGYCLGKTKLLPRSALPAFTNVVVYLAWSTKLVEGTPYNAVATVPIR